MGVRFYYTSPLKIIKPSLRLYFYLCCTDQVIMKKTRYSDILGDLFYHIKLSEELKDLIDTHFTGAAHHLRRFEEADMKEHRHFHLVRHRLHLRLMMTLIHNYGDFSEAIDPTNRDLEFRETWNPEFTTLPDPGMFRKMAPDWRYLVGESHCSDHYLHEQDWLNHSQRQ